jgi:1-acyl-sn-glycerol-3-phosphate acyltransferase
VAEARVIRLHDDERVARGRGKPRTAPVGGADAAAGEGEAAQSRSSEQGDTERHRYERPRVERRPTEGSPSERSPSEGSFFEGSASEGSVSAGSVSAGSVSAGSVSAGSVSEGSVSEGSVSEGSASERPASGWERQVASGLAFLRRRLTGDYEVDEFGFDADLTESTVLPVARQLYRYWFRTEVLGVHNLPTQGGALIVGNHAGGLWALDGVMTATAVHEETPGRRFLRMLGADLVFTTPVLGPLARKTGSTLACNPDAERLLANGELVGVWPEGFKGIGKPFSERYKLQRFGRGGFVSAALRTGAPIIPTSIVGSEEIHPVIGNAKTVARLLGLPYFPLTPTFPWLGPLGVIPLPSKWYIEFGEPIDTAGYGPEAAEDPMLVFELTDRVREQIQGTLYRLLMQRRSVWR